MARNLTFQSASLGQPQSQTVGLPDVPSDVSDNLKTFLQRVKEILETREGQRGGALQRGVLLGDMVEAGLYDVSTGTFSALGGDNTPPNPPRNLAAFQRGSYNLVTWTNPTDDDLDFVEIWAAENSTSLTNAKLRGVIKSPGEIFQHTGIKLVSGYNYWARAADTSMNYSGWTTTVVHTDPGLDTAGGDLYDIFFGDLSQNPGVLRIRAALETVGAYYYTDSDYYVGDVVIYGGYVFQSIKNNPAPSRPPEDATYWKQYNSLADVTVQNEARITQSEGQILLRATKTEVQENIDTINSVMAATFALQAEQINARVAKTDFYPVEQLAKDNAAQLQIQASQIAAKVSQTAFDLLNGQVATVSSEVNQMSDSWTVRIQSLDNGVKAVTGIDLAINDGTGQSQFIVMADNFRVVSSAGSTPLGMFAVNENGTYISNTLFAPGGIQTSHLAADSVTADKIAAGAVTASEIAANSVTTEKLAASSVTAEKVAAGSITADKIAAQSITADKIASGAISADMITTGTLDGNLIRENGIQISKINNGIVLSVVPGTTACVLQSGRTHVYFATVVAHGRGTITFQSTIGNETFILNSFWGQDNEDIYPYLNFSTIKSGTTDYSTGNWVAGDGVTIDSASIVGIVIK